MSRSILILTLSFVFFRSEAMLDLAVDYVMSDKYYSHALENKNWISQDYRENIDRKIVNRDYLKNRAGKLLLKAKKELASFYEDEYKIIIPWSGGKDSSCLLALSLKIFPEKTYYLLTVINGMCGKIENPNIRINQILYAMQINRQHLNLKHIYIDNISDIEDLVLDSAETDKELLGSPAICSSCKMIMEKSLINSAKNLDSTKIAMGYVKYQGMQNWPEQTSQQIDFLENEARQCGVFIGSPLYSVLKYPFDPILLLAYLGIPHDCTKFEMKCAGAGLNPVDIDSVRFGQFLEFKMNKVKKRLDEQTPVFFDVETILSTVGLQNEFGRLIDKMKRLKSSESFSSGSFRN